MRRFRVYMVVDAPSEQALTYALEQAEDRMLHEYDQVVQFRSIVEGYDGEFADRGAMPSDWVDTSAGALASKPHDHNTCPTCEKIADGHTCNGRDAGWYIDERGRLQACAKCTLYADGDEVARVVACLTKLHQIDLGKEGWCVIHANEERWEIERDDEAGIFPDDDAAIAAAIAKLSEITGRYVGPRA